MNDADRQRLAEIAQRSARENEYGVLAGLEPRDNDIDFLLRLVAAAAVERIEKLAEAECAIEEHDARVTELLAANNREVERRRAAVAALRHLRRRFSGTVVDPYELGAAWVMDVDGKSVWVPEFIDAAIAAAEAPDPRGPDAAGTH